MFRPVLLRFVGSLSLLCYITHLTFGSEATRIPEWLAHRIVSPDQVQGELERYLEARIPRLPSVTTRQEWERYADRLRRDMLQNVVLRGAGQAWSAAPLKIDWQEVIHGGEGYRIKKLRYEAVPGMWIPALLYEPLEGNAPFPVALNVNGHDGLGKAAVYKQMRCINQAKRGMLALNVEWLGMGQLRGAGYSHGRMNQLDLCGTSGLAPFYLAMQKGLDLLLAHPHADSRRVAVAGLSGGGWQTIFISALDERVTLVNPVAGYSSFRTRIRNHSDLGDSEQTPSDMATVGDYAHLTALLAPRATLLTYNEKDECCFASAHALPPLLEAATPVFSVYGEKSRLHAHVNHDPGTHNFERENREALYQMLATYFSVKPPELSAGSALIPVRAASEIESQTEVKTADQLHVSLPVLNADFHTLARLLAESVPINASWPSEAGDVAGWQQKQRSRLREMLRIRDLVVVAELVQESTDADLTATHYRLCLADSWTVPFVEIAPQQPTGTTMIIGEQGKSSLADRAREALGANRRVVALDPFYVGELAPQNRPYLWALLVQTVGDRPAGLQASQLIAVARWLKQRHPDEPIELDSNGARLALGALAAAAVESQAIESLRLRGSFASLHEVIDNNLSFDTHPELFPFGLLERFDLVTIAALCAPRKVYFVAASDRHRQALGKLAPLYEELGYPFDPTNSSLAQ